MKTVVSKFNVIDKYKSLSNDIKTMSKFFKLSFVITLSNLAESFPAKLPDPSNKYNLESIFLYYSNLAIPKVFHIKSTSEEKVFKTMEKIEISTATGREKICNLSTSHGIFPNDCQHYFQERQRSRSI